MKNLFISFFVFSLAITYGQNQKLVATELNSVELSTDDFLGYDSFGYSYSIKNNVLSKIKGTESFEYKNPSLGKITKTNLQSPLKIILFYEDFNTVIILDNQLNETQKINFSENSSPIVVTAIGMASQNQLWIYNSLNQQIGLYDYLKNSYKSISTSFPESITLYQSDFNSFYWIDKNNQWYSCDIFGKITSKGKLPEFDSIAIINDHQYIYYRDKTFIFQDIEKNQKFEIEISEKTFEKFYFQDQILSIFTKGVITNYKIATP